VNKILIADGLAMSHVIYALHQVYQIVLIGEIIREEIG
jgi:hypothetical protein